MRRPEFIAKHGKCPSGVLGGIIAQILGRQTASENRYALELLQLQPADSVLEVGFGPGWMIPQVARLASNGFVAGVDVSERMVHIAMRRNRRLIAQGRVELKLADSRQLPYPSRHFDKAYSVHTIYFWDAPEEHLREIGRVMKAGGRLVLGFRPRDSRALANFPSSIYTFYTCEEVRAFLDRARFVNIQKVMQVFSGREIVLVLAHWAG